MIKIDSNDKLSEVSFEDGCSVVVVTHRRLDLLKRLIVSLSKAVSCTNDFRSQFIFCVNGADAETQQFLESDPAVRSFNPQIIALASPVSPAEARNLATERVNLSWVAFLDDDVEVPHDYFQNFLSLQKKNPKVAVWGGPNLTPPQSSAAQQRIGWYLGNPLVTGPISRRYRLYSHEARGGEFTFSLCNMFVKTKVFNTFKFNVGLKTAEENELIHEIGSVGYQMKTSGALFVWHSRRTGLDGFLRQIRNYGFGRGQVIHNGRVSALIPTLIPICVGGSAYAVALLPAQLCGIIFIWLGIVYLQVIRKFGFNSETSREFLFPMKIAFNYLLGVILGYAAALRASRARVSKAKPSS